MTLALIVFLVEEDVSFKLTLAFSFSANLFNASLEFPTPKIVQTSLAMNHG